MLETTSNVSTPVAELLFARPWSEWLLRIRSSPSLIRVYPPVGFTQAFNEFALFRKSANLACTRMDVRAAGGMTALTPGMG